MTVMVMMVVVMTMMVGDGYYEQILRASNL
jgi:hypothetical protein